jgi:hypothetical protein
MEKNMDMKFFVHFDKSCIAAKVVKYAAMHYVFEDLSRDRSLWFVICSLVSFVFFLIEELYLNLTL